MKKILISPLLIITSIAYAVPDYEIKHEIIMDKYFITPPNTNVNIHATIYNSLTNNTDTRIHIFAYYNLYIEGCGVDKHHWDIWVNPHGTWRDHWRPSKECRFPAGNYRIDAQGSVEGLDKQLHSDAWSYGAVMVR